MRNPVEFLEQCGSYLKPDGVLALSTFERGYLVSEIAWQALAMADEHASFLFQQINTPDRAQFGRIRTGPRFALYPLRASSVRRQWHASGPAQLHAQTRVLARRLIPDLLVVPISLGDIKLYVARRRAGPLDAMNP